MTTNHRVPFAATLLARADQANRSSSDDAHASGVQPDTAPVRPGPAALVASAPIPLGEVTRRHLARVLEQQQGALLLCCVELGGGDPQGRWRLTIGDARLEPEGPAG